MPAKAPDMTPAVANKLATLGLEIRQKRKSLRISATVTAEAAGMSRVTLHRIENGEPSVTMGAYLSVMAALDIDFGILQPQTTGTRPDTSEGMIPVRIYLSEYPQLKKLAWQIHGTDALTPVEALSIYERNWRYVDTAQLEPHEQQLIDALRAGLGSSSGTI